MNSQPIYRGDIKARAAIFMRGAQSNIKFFANISNFFPRFTQSLNKVTVEICPNFYSGLFKNCLASFQRVFRFFSYTQITFLKKLIVSNIFCLNFMLRFIKLFTIIPVLSKFIPEFHKFYLKFCQTKRKIYPKLPEDLVYLFSVCVVLNFEKIFLKIYSKF